MQTVIFVVISFVAFVILYIFFVFFLGHSAKDRKFWDALLLLAIDRNATNILFHGGEAVRCKINGEWQELLPNLITQVKELNHLKSLLQTDTWLLPGKGIATVVRNEDLAVEFELKIGNYY